jgi:hypothetical protein
MVSDPIHGDARRLAFLVSLSFLSMALWLTAAGPTFACSCVPAEPMAAYATVDHAIFAGTAGPSDARGVPVRVAQWFSGRGAAPLVYLSAQSFTGEASCGTSLPPAGTNWIWVTFLPEGGGDPVTGLCNPHGQLGTSEGDALLDDATATFGGTAPPGATATDPPEAAPGPSVVPEEAGGAILLGTVGLAFALLFGVVLLARRRVRPDL